MASSTMRRRSSSGSGALAGPLAGVAYLTSVAKNFAGLSSGGLGALGLLKERFSPCPVAPLVLQMPTCRPFLEVALVLVMAPMTSSIVGGWTMRLPGRAPDIAGIGSDCLAAVVA